MEEVQSQQPTADVSDASLTPSPEGSGGAPEQANNDAMNSFIRQASQGRSSLNLGGVVPTAELDQAPEAESAPQPGDVSANGSQSDAGTQPGRRASKAQESQQRIDELAAENARLKADLDAANPPPPDATEEARKQYRETEQRYRRLREKPDTDTDWDQGEYDWLQTEKQKRALVPDLTAQYEAALEAERETHEATFGAKWQGFVDYFRDDMNATMDLPGLDDATKAALREDTRFSSHVYAQRRAERAIVEAEHADEMAHLRAENAELKRQALGAMPSVPNGGRSAGGSATHDPNAWLRQMIRP